AVAAGRLTRDERNELLRSMTDDVASLVLRDNVLQNDTLTRNVLWGERFVPARLLAMRALELSGAMDRAFESLPSDEAFAERQAAGDDLSVPELGVLLAHSKIALYEELLGSELPDEPRLVGELGRYFPPALAERFTEEMENHLLRRAIVANAIANELFNRMEISFVARLQTQTERPAAQVAAAYVAAREILEMRAVWAELDTMVLADPATEAAIA